MTEQAHISPTGDIRGTLADAMRVDEIDLLISNPEEFVKVTRQPLRISTGYPGGVSLLRKLRMRVLRYLHDK